MKLKNLIKLDLLRILILMQKIPVNNLIKKKIQVVSKEEVDKIERIRLQKKLRITKLNNLIIKVIP